MPTIHLNIYGEGTPVVLIHGFPLSSKIWDIQKKLADHIQLVLPDLPGNGKTPYFPFTLESVADELHHALQEKGLSKIILMGHSMGGYISLAFAEKYKKDLLKFGLVCSHPFADTDAIREVRQNMINRIQDEGSGFVAESQIPKIFGEYSIKNRKSAIAIAYDIMKSSAEKAVINGQEAMMVRPERTSVLTGLNCPIFLANGTDDPTIPEKKRQALLELLPHATSVLFENVGHMPMMEVGDDFNEKLLHFIRQD